MVQFRVTINIYLAVGHMSQLNTQSRLSDLDTLANFYVIAITF